MDMAAILFNDADKLIIPFDRRPNVKSGEKWSSFSVKKTFKDFEFFYTCSQGADNPGGQNFDCN